MSRYHILRNYSRSQDSGIGSELASAELAESVTFSVILSSLKISLLKSNGGAKGLYSGASQFLTLGGTVISQLLRIVSMTKEMQ